MVWSICQIYNDILSSTFLVFPSTSHVHLQAGGLWMWRKGSLSMFATLYVTSSLILMKTTQVFTSDPQVQLSRIPFISLMWVLIGRMRSTGEHTTRQTSDIHMVVLPGVYRLPPLHCTEDAKSWTLAKALISSRLVIGKQKERGRKEK